MSASPDINHAGNRYTRHLDPRQDSCTRIYKVSGIAGLTSPAYMFDAANDAGLPAIGSAHPQNSALIVRTIQAAADPKHPDGVYVEVQYGAPEIVVSDTAPPEWEIDTFLAEVETDFDRNGNQITVVYVPTGGTPPGRTQGGTVRFQLAVVRLRGVRVESAHPYAKILAYKGKTNAAAWGPFGVLEPARSWFLTIRARTGGTPYTVEYELLRLMDRLDSEVRFIGDDGQPPADLDAGTGNGVSFPEVIEQADFDALDLI